MALLVDCELNYADHVGDDALGILEANSEVVVPSDTGQIFDVVGIHRLVVFEAVLVGGTVSGLALSTLVLESHQILRVYV